MNGRKCGKCGATLEPRVLPVLQCPSCGRFPETVNHRATIGCLSQSLLGVSTAITVGLVADQIVRQLGWRRELAFGFGFVAGMDCVGVAISRSHIAAGIKDDSPVWKAFVWSWVGLIPFLHIDRRIGLLVSLANGLSGYLIARLLQRHPQQVDDANCHARTSDESGGDET